MVLQEILCEIWDNALVLPRRKAKPTIDDMIRSALNDVVGLIAEPSFVIPLETSRARDDCAETVLDYLDHNEAEIALEHLIYVIGDADLPIENSTYEMIQSAATLMAFDPGKYRGIDPRQEPIDSLVQLRKVSHQTYTLAIKLLSTVWIDKNSHSGPFPGTHLAELTDLDAVPILDLLNQLEPATRARCHTPRYSMVMWGPDVPVAEVALCFRCNNGRTRIGGALGWISFNGKSEPAIELLEWIELIEADRQS